MINFHKWILIGLLFILLDIWIVVDILPDFLGVFFIAYAFAKAEGTHAKWGFWCAVVLGALLMPSVLEDVASTPEKYLPTWVFITNKVITYLYIFIYAALFFVSSERVGEKKIGKIAIIFIALQMLIVTWGIVSPHISYSIRQQLESFILLTIVIFAIIYIACIVRIWKRIKLEDSFMKMNQKDVEVDFI